MIAQGANDLSMVHPLLIAAATLAAATAPIHLNSADLAAGRAVPKTFMARDCGGTNTSPSLSWSGVPQGTKSFALILHDADAPISGGFYHWVVYNLPAQTRRLERNVTLAPDELGESSTGRAQYYGPCPPPGPAHHYTITLYALDVSHFAAVAPLTGAALERQMEGHVIARGILQNTASTP
ncbi:MAG TPA: YbhB/YbcL family Raf kinase inhibitor-like protein [Candidatus Cybelea sp.]|nr:YbhB/YbcL family Raf kinase inhibitor-like protein [Candidatus Cybelea sp.]